jgi:hypothetical protein
MTCLTGGLTPCSAATGIPGPPATSSSPTCRARAAPTKAFPGTPWSGARQTAAAQPGTARDTTRPTRHPPAPPGSQAGSHHHPTQGDPEPTEAFDTPAVTRHSATVADGSRQTGSRSHRGSGLATASHSHADERMFRICMVIHLSAYRHGCGTSPLRLAGRVSTRLSPIRARLSSCLPSGWPHA